MNKTSQEEFIKRAKDNYPQYDYSITQYNGLNNKVEAICPIHGKFNARPDYFLHKNKFREPCKYCFLEHKKNNRGIKYTKEQILFKLKENTNEFIIENINDLENNINLNSHDYVYLKCKKCGFKIKKKLVVLIYNEYNCKICKKQKKQLNNAIKKMNIFLKKAKLLFPQYDYSLVEPYLEGRGEKYIIICPKHGKQIICPNTFYKNGCPMCGTNIRSQYKMIRRTYSNEQFINELIDIYGDEYDYSKVNYKNWKTKVLLKCKKHGEFLREPQRLIKEHRGCPHCQKSLLEQDIMNFLNKNNIKYINQYHIGLKRLDFYLPEYNIAIECQGRQHLFLDSIFNTNITSVEELYQNDKIKLELSKKAGIKNILYFSTYKVDNYFEKLFTKKDELLKEIYKYERLL